MPDYTSDDMDTDNDKDSTVHEKIVQTESGVARVEWDEPDAPEPADDTDPVDQAVRAAGAYLHAGVSTGQPSVHIMVMDDGEVRVSYTTEATYGGDRA